MPRTTALPPLASEVQQIRELLPPPERRGRPAGRERNVQVLCRFRGQSEAEERRGGGGVWELGETTVAATQGSGTPLVFSYDRVFGPEDQQPEVYEAVEPVVRGVLSGVNGAVMCYGQTSAGKTFTMEGVEGGGEELAGIIPRALGTIFAAAAEAEAEDEPCRVTLSMLEVYMERLRDLLDPESEAELRIVEDRAKGVQVCGLHEVGVRDLQTALEVVRSGQRNRCVAATGMNDRSSRSHSVFMIRVEWPNCQRTGAKLYLVDLAGSECLKKACLRGGDEAAAANAEIVEEAKAINQSLTTLGMVISRLADRRRAAADQHVPYRSSKLTRVLQDSLGGNSHTILVVNCAPSAFHAPETLSTLRFGARARSVVNVVSGSPAAEDSLLLQTLRAARLEIQRLRTAASAAGSGAADVAGGMVAGSLSMVSALTPCSEGPPSPLDVSPARRVSRGGYPRPQFGSLWERESGRSLSPIHSRRSMNMLSPLQLSPRRSAAASLAPSRRVSCQGPRSRRMSRMSVAGSRRVSLAMTEDYDPRDGDLSPLELSPGTSVAVSRRVSRVGLRLSCADRLEECTPEDDEEEHTALSDLSPTRPSVHQVSPVPFRESLGGGFDSFLRYWEFPMTRQEKFERLLLVRDKEVDKLQEQIEQERSKHDRKFLHLEEQLAALQTENEWLTADRMQHIEQVVRSSLGPDSDESPEGEDPEKNKLWATCMEEPLEADDEDASPAGAGADGAAGPPGAMGREELQAALLEEQQRSAELLREREAVLGKERESLAEIKGAHEAALAREQRNLAQLQSMHEAALAKEREQAAQLRSAHEAALAKEKEGRVQLESSLEAALARERESKAQLETSLEAALLKEEESKARVESSFEAALAKEKDGKAQLESQLQAALQREEGTKAQFMSSLEAALAKERQSRGQLEAALLKEKESKSQLETSLEAVLAREKEGKVQVEAELQAALAKEKASKALLESSLEAALIREKESRAQLEVSLQAALEKEKESRAQLERSLEAALAKERESKAAVESHLQAVVAKEQDSIAHLRREHEETLSDTLAASESLKEELARVRGELFVAAGARELAAKRAAAAEQTLLEESSAATAEREHARERLQKASMAEERISQVSIAALAERSAELQKAQALQAEAEERAFALEAALKDECESRLQLQHAHEALDAVHRDLEEQFRSAAVSRASLREEARVAEDLCTKAAADRAMVEANKRRRFWPFLVWFATLMVALALGHTFRAP